MPKTAISVVRNVDSDEREQEGMDDSADEDYTDIDLEDFMKSSSESEESDPEEESTEVEEVESESDSDSNVEESEFRDDHQPEVCVAAPPKVIT